MKLRIEKAIYGGSGLARVPLEGGEHAGKAVFVPLALPGEMVEAHLIDNRKSYVSGAVDTVLEPSPARTLPECPYFPVCGGCQYQHATYLEQLAMKLVILRETLARAHVETPAEIATVSAEPWQYRNRIRMHVCAMPEFTLAYRQAGTHRNLPVELCPVAAPVLQQTLTVLQRIGRALGLTAELWKEIELFTSPDEDALLLSFFGHAADALRSAEVRSMDTLCAALQAEISALRGAVLLRGGEHKAVSRRTHTWGETSLLYPVGGFNYRVSAGSFFQVNRFLAPRLLELAVSGRSGDLAWDLYAGVGLFARALTRSFRRVVAVESASSSSADLKRNLAGTQHQVVAAETARFLQAEARRKPRARPDLVLLDPPRAGLGPQVCGSLAAIAPKEVVYVSCDPATLARDLSALQRSGYRIDCMSLVDLFPQTFHLESVTVLTRS